jgi:hypothetical protein
MCAVNYLSQCVMEESILDIKLVDRPILGDSKGQDGANCHELHNGAESLIIINVGMLHEHVKTLASFVPLECPIDLELVLEDPLVGDNISATGVQNQVPIVVGHESGTLFLHSRPPMRKGEGEPN